MRNYLIMKIFDVEFGAQFFLCHMAQSLYFQAGKQVRGGLSRRCYIAIYFGCNGIIPCRSMFEHVFNSFLASPSHGMQTRTDDESCSPIGFVRQIGLAAHISAVISLAVRDR